MGDPLTVDVYEGDEERVGVIDWDHYEAAGDPWNGAIIKATQGRHYAPTWFQRTWPKLKGRRFRRGCYHYLMMNDDGSAQADYFVDFVEKAGGFEAGDFDPVVDVETKGNELATKDQVITCTRAFVDRVKERTGRDVIIYGGTLMYDLGITDRFGGSLLWIARYTATLPAVVYERIGWDLGSVFGWQYCGDGEGYLEGYPVTSPIGAVDITAMVNGINPDRGISSLLPVVGAVCGIVLLLWMFG